MCDWLSLLRPKDRESLDLQPDPIQRLPRRDVQRLAVFAGKHAVCRSFRHCDESDLLSLRIEDVDAARFAVAGRSIDVALHVHAHAVNAALLAEIVKQPL